MLSEGGRRPDFNDSLQVVQERAEGPKALSPGQRPGYTSNLQCALQGQKLYIIFLLLASIHKYFGIGLYEFPKLTLQYYSRLSINHQIK